MPQKVLKFTGINRKINEFQGGGACEELVNLRPSQIGHQVVKDKKVKIASASGYESIIEHKFGNQENLLAITSDGVKWVSDAGIVKQTLSGTYGAEDVSCAGNVILVKLPDSNKAFKFEEDAYSEYLVSIPFVNISVSLDEVVPADQVFNASGASVQTDHQQVAALARETLANAYSSFYKSNVNGLAGPIIIGCTFELEDGSEVWSSGFTIIDPTKDKRFKPASYGLIGASGIPTAYVYGASEAILKFSIENYKDVNGVKNIRFYSSLPVSPYEIKDIGNTLVATKRDKVEMGITRQHMYLQKVLSFRSSGSFLLNTEYTLASNDLMPVTVGTICRSGSNVSYNNRFHFFNSSVQHLLQNPTHCFHSNIELPEADTYNDIRSARLSIVINNGEEKIRVVRGGSFNVLMGSMMDFVYPMGGIKDGYLEISNDGFATSRWYPIKFNDSESYNYSYAVDCLISTQTTMPTGMSLTEAHAYSVLWKKEQNAINVSAQFNPFVFPVEYSYNFNGEIRDVATSYLPISSTQIGQYPLSVFTSNGVYALEQGDGSVLYGNIVPLQPVVISGKAASTPYGTFFVSSNNLYVLSGREIINVSNPLNGERELNLRNNESYKRLCTSGIAPFVSFSNVLSATDFEEFIPNAILTYDQLNNEVYISNDTVEYSYVYNLDTNLFHKIDRKYLGSRSSSRYAVAQKRSLRTIVDMHTEVKGSRSILLQSRPMSLEMLYTHIQRLMLLVDAKLEGSQYLCISVFGSDNLNDWKCIISAQKQNAVLRQIRTNKAAKSYKDYIILINGVVDTNTDISDIIADYTVVNRRIG